MIDAGIAPVADVAAPAGRRPRAVWVLLALLVVHLAMGLAYSALNPLGEAPDEADHWAYAAFISRAWRLPEGTSMTQAKHPPLYHILAAAAAAPVISRADCKGCPILLRSNPDVGFTADAAPNFFIHTRLDDWPWRGDALAMHLGRLVSVLAGLILTATTYGLGRRVWPDRPALGLAAAAFVGFLPEGLFISGSMSNDILAAMFATLALWAGLWRPVPSETPPAGGGRGRRWGFLAGLFMGLAFLTKVSTVALWPAIFLAMWLARISGVTLRDILRALRAPLLASLVVLLIASPWLWRNTRLFGDPLGMAMARATVDLRQGPLGWSDLVGLARGWFFSFWGKFGGAGHLALPWPFYVAWGILLAAAALGWLRWLLSAILRRPGLLRNTSAGAAIVLWTSPALAALSIISYSMVALGTDQGRLLFPAIAPIALLLVGGLAAWLPARRSGWLAAGLSVLMIAASGLALYFGILQPFAPPPFAAADEVARASRLDANVGEDLRLVGMAWGEPTSESTTPLVLYWQALRPVQDDLRVALRLIDPYGNLVWEWKRSPGQGRLSTDRWQTGQTIADLYHVPVEYLGRAARVEVKVYPFSTGAPADDAEGQSLP